MNRKIILCGAGANGKEYLHLLGREKIVFFVDRNVDLQKTGVENVAVKSYEELFRTPDCGDIIITVNEPVKSEIAKDLDEHHLTYWRSIEEYFLSQNGARAMEKYHNIHEGESCFLVGSGPSLTVDDLEKLQAKHITVFAPNKIFKLFDQTRWRPDYYVVTDRRIMNFYQEEIGNLQLEHRFFAYYRDKALQNFYRNICRNDAHLFCMKDVNGTDDYYDFSTDPGEYIVEGRTVIYAMAQLAYYMGFKKMYLLGVDFSYADQTGYDKNGKDHFCKDYIEEGETVLITPREYALRAFESADHFAKQHGIEIFNATRGGCLEVFERVDMDEFLQGEAK